MTRERISRILELRETPLLFQTGFHLVNAVVVCAILESISGLEPSSVITEPRYLKLVAVSSFCPFTLISVLMPECRVPQVIHWSGLCSCLRVIVCPHLLEVLYVVFD